MRVVVTGATGFLGRTLLKTLQRTGVECLGVSRKNEPGFVPVANYCETPPGDVLIHLAEASNRGWVNAQGEKYRSEAGRTLEALLVKGYEKIIYTSSAVLYGDRSATPRRTDDPILATDVYSQIKLRSEQTVLEHGGGVVRLANLYGVGMSQDNVLSAILGQIRGNGPITLLDTTPVRDFLWVEDAALLVEAMMTAKACGIFNAGTGIGTSIGDLARTALSAAGQPAREIMAIKKDSLPSTLVVDITRTEAEFSWRPAVSVRDGVGRLVNLTH